MPIINKCAKLNTDKFNRVLRNPNSWAKIEAINKTHAIKKTYKVLNLTSMANTIGMRI
tara:strand:- start:233 stop:406 length:174 start_codon:yes stop_codon:yes gene_type:complete